MKSPALRRDQHDCRTKGHRKQRSDEMNQPQARHAHAIEPGRADHQMTKHRLIALVLDDKERPDRAVAEAQAGHRIFAFAKALSANGE